MIIESGWYCKKIDSSTKHVDERRVCFFKCRWCSNTLGSIKLEPGPNVDGGSVVLPVTEALGVLVYFVRRGGERNWLLQLVAHAQR